MRRGKQQNGRILRAVDPKLSEPTLSTGRRGGINEACLLTCHYNDTILKVIQYSRALDVRQENNGFHQIFDMHRVNGGRLAKTGVFTMFDEVYDAGIQVGDNQCRRV